MRAGPTCPCGALNAVTGMAATGDGEPVDDRVADGVRMVRIDEIRIRFSIGRDIQRLGVGSTGG